MSSTPKWTDSQKLAIDTRDRQVLVAASAGTGKTAVLSERVAQAVADPQGGVDIERILVLTFTEAAAEEMRARIAARLRAEAKSRKDRALRSQLLRIDAAHISTIHAFCKHILDANFFEVGLDPCYSIIDEDERRLLKGDILRQVIDEAWADEQLAGDLSALLQGRTVKARGDDFLATIPRVCDFLEGVVDAEQWLALAESAPDWSQAGRHLVSERLDECRQRFAFAAHLDRTLADGAYLTQQIESEYIPQIEALMEHLTKVEANTWAADLQEFKWSNAKRKPKDLDKDQAEVIKEAVNAAKDGLTKLKAWTLCTPGSEAILGPLVTQQSRTLVTLVRRFRTAFVAAKRQRNCLDFADLEHGLLRLLHDQPVIAERLAQSFDLIFVDEYQDVNAVQQAILDRVGRRDNIFCVGDVKQSIYAFRQSRPEIFLGQLQQAQPDITPDKHPLRVDLQANFRSRHEVLNFANAVFARVMTEDVCGMAYDDKAALIGGAAYDPLPAGTTAVELAILDETDPEAADDHPGHDEEGGEVELISASQRQASFIANRIHNMVEQERIEVLDRGTQTRRPVRYGDIVILMRSLSGRAPQMVEILRLAGIPVSSQATSGYFDALEISDMLSLLRVLDNPRRDVELAAVLRSALFGFSDNDLVAIRLADTQGGRGRSYYESLLTAEQQAEDGNLRQRLTEALAQLQQWRSLARQGSLAQLLWEVYRDTGYLAYVTALPNGAQRQANLLKLHDRAIQFEGFHEGSLRSLSRFVEFAEKLLQEGGDWAPAEPDSAAEDAVRIMTVHRSKGLEFPVVFLAELNRGFNRMDSRGACLLHEQYGLGLQVVEPERRARFNSVGYEIIKEQQGRQTLAEEMRILYVALTRARERLILCGSVKSDHCRKLVSQGAMVETGPLPAWMAGGADCHLDWLLSGLAHTRPLQGRFLETPTSNEGDSLYQLHCLDRDELNRITQSILHLRNTRSQARSLPQQAPKSPPDWARAVEVSLAWNYPYQHATGTAAKQSVSELSHQGDEFSQLDVSRALESRPQVAQKSKSKSASGKGKVDPRELGTAMHLVFETLPLDQNPTQASIQSHVASLVAHDRLPAGLLNDRHIKAVEKFYVSSLGQQCLDPQNQVLREWPFTMRVPESQDSEDFVVVQGIVDLIIVTPEAYHVVDFKTDQVTSKDVAERAKLYETQLQLYAQAVQGILPTKEVKLGLYFLKSGDFVKVL